MPLKQHIDDATAGKCRSDVSFQAVIFDVDGTLADTERQGHRVAFNRAFAQTGLKWYWSVEAYGELLQVTGGKERIRHYATRHAPEWLAQANCHRTLADLHQLKTRFYTEMIEAGDVRLRPGVKRLLNELHTAGVRLAIATTTTLSSLLSLLIANLGEQAVSLFEVMGAGDVVRNKKPAPDIYDWVLRAMDLPPRVCLAIEDSRLGAAAATAAAIPTVVTVSPYTEHDEFSDVLAVVTDLGEPGAPARRLSGQSLGGDVVNLAQLRVWHATAAAAAPTTVHWAKA